MLTSRERKQVFEKYVKERAEEERREKRNKMRQKRDAFKSLMEGVNLHGKYVYLYEYMDKCQYELKKVMFLVSFRFRSSFSDFAQKHGKDERFKGIEKTRDRESLFNEYLLEVRRREKDEKLQKKETVSMKIIGQRSLIYTNYNYIRIHKLCILFSDENSK